MGGWLAEWMDGCLDGWMGRRMELSFGMRVNRLKEKIGREKVGEGTDTGDGGVDNRLVKLYSRRRRHQSMSSGQQRAINTRSIDPTHDALIQSVKMINAQQKNNHINPFLTRSVLASPPYTPRSPQTP